ncbi:MAG: hypothetical protein HY318_03975 [Armatimonadetes bacterium]|nr:hypothetical protein [Armatimonadota bacterium]
MLAEEVGGFEPSQWYRLRAQIEGNRLRASIDGVPALNAKDAGFGQGKMGLYLSTGDGAATAQFDDVTVESVNTIREDRLIAERVPGAFAVDPIMRRWATEEDWWAGNAEKGYWHRGVFFKDPLLQLPLPPTPPSEAKLVATICASDEHSGSGYALEINDESPKGSGQPSARLWRLRRLGKPVVETWKAMSSEWKSLVFRQQGRRVIVQAEEEELMSFSDPRPLRGDRVGFKTAGFAVDKSRATCLSPCMEDCAFAEAPVDWWVERGTWESMQRWGCWGQSHFGAYDPVAAITWTKKSYAGDIVVECYCSNAPMGDSPTAVHDLNISLCGDGANLVSGYSFIFAGTGGNTQILKRNRVVAQKPFTGAKQNISQDWFCLRVEKRGGRLRMFVDHQPVLECADPEPLRVGKVALWTATGSIVLARVRVWYERGAGVEPIPKPCLQLASRTASWLRGSSSDRSSGLPDRAVTFDFEQDCGSLTTRDTVDAAILSFDDKTASKGKRSLRVTNRVCGGHFALWVTKEPFDAKQHPVVGFDYKVPPNVHVNLYAKVKGAWHTIAFTAGEPEKKDKVLGSIKGVVGDNRWRHAEFNLLEALQARFGSENLPRVEGLSIASPNERGLRLGFEGNPFGASYHLDELRL